jgi:hypothetical protein
MSLELIIYAAVTAITMGYSAYKSNQMKKRAEAQASDSPSPIPYITESDVIPVVFGTIDITGPGIVEATGPRKSGSTEAQAFSSDINRWWEWNYVRVVLCHGRVDNVAVYIDNQFKQILSVGIYPLLSAFGGKTDKQDLFGWASLGRLSPDAPPTQSASLTSINWQGQSLRLPGIAYALVESWRYGVASGDGVWSAKPQFPDGVSWRVQRINFRHGQTGATGWTDASQWEPSLALIPAPPATGEAAQMNPAHILRELLTDRVWGMGQSELTIDDASFLAAAEVLHGEDFGLSYLWAQETSAADFAAEILRHIDGLMYQEPSTGLYVLKLVRDGSNALHFLTSFSVVTSPPEYSRPGYDQLVTRVTVIYRTLRFRREASISVHDQALTEDLGDIPVTMRYDGVYSPTLAAKLAGRDLRRLSTPLASVRMSVTWEAGKDIRAGDRVQWAWPAYGVFGMRLRVVGVTYGELGASSVTLDCLEDVFTSLQSIYATPTESLYIEPNYTAVESYPFAMELPLALSFLGPSIAEYDSRGAVVSLAPAPSIRALFHSGWDLATDEIVRKDNLGFCQTIYLDAPVSFSGMTNPGAATLTATPSFDLAVNKDYLCVFNRPDGTDEIVVITLTSGGNIRMTRGTYDTTVYYGTVPDGTVIYVISESTARNPSGGAAVTDDLSYTLNRSVLVKALPRTSRDTLSLSAATPFSTIIASRQLRPTCPGFVSASFASGTGTSISWRRRNRLVDPICTQACPDIAPEAGTTHRLNIEGLSAATGGVFVQVQGLTLAATATSYLYTTAQEDTDHKTFPGGAGNFAQLRMTLYSIRDGVESWQRQIRVRS